MSHRNPFLEQLLALQQDGRGAISAPSNWKERPLLEVKTRLEEEMDELADAIAPPGERREVGRWHFLVGSPGNGKSAATGYLCRILGEKHGLEIVDEEGISLDELPSDRLPYLLKVRRPGEKFSIAWIVQDATVVRRPFSGEPDPPGDLADTLDEATKRGVSLVVCANRGVLEELVARLRHLQGHQRPAWGHVVRGLVEEEDHAPIEIEFRGKHLVFSRARVTRTYLDSRSLLVDEPILERVLQEATRADRWEACSGCHAASLCPFKANRDYLATGEGRRSLLRILTRAEFTDGQVIVFREALSLVSLLLAGCPADYGDAHPCDWVNGRCRKGDVFSLACRRLYMLLFAATDRLGFESFILEEHRDSLQLLRETVEDAEPLRVALDHALARRGPSTDVGLARLVGEGGVLRRLDPLRWPLGQGFLEKWDADYEVLRAAESPLVGELERQCLDAWAHAESLLEDQDHHEAVTSYWILRRWSSSFLLRLGALEEGRTAWEKELDDFVTVYKAAKASGRPLGREEQEHVGELQRSLRDVLLGDNGVQLNESTWLQGGWPKRHLEPRVERGTVPGTLAIRVVFGAGGGSTEETALGASTYCWLRMISPRSHWVLDPRCLPPEFLAGALDARRRAATRGGYAFEKDVSLLVQGTRGEKFFLDRQWDEVSVRCEGEACDE